MQKMAQGEEGPNMSIISSSVRHLNEMIDLISESANSLAHKLDWVLRPVGPDSPEKSMAEAKPPLSQLTITLDDFTYRIDRTRQLLIELCERCEL